MKQIRFVQSSHLKSRRKRQICLLNDTRSLLSLLCKQKCLLYFDVSCQLKAPFLIKSFTSVYENDLGEVGTSFPFLIPGETSLPATHWIINIENIYTFKETNIYNLKQNYFFVFCVLFKSSCFLQSVALGQMQDKGDCIGSATFCPQNSLIFNSAEQFGNFWDIFVMSFCHWG